MKNWQFLYESNQLSRFSCLNFLRNKQVRTRTIKITLATPTCSFLLHFLTKKIPMTTTMASLGLLIHLLLLATLFARILAPKLPITSTLISPFRCNTLIKSCNASLHHISNTVPKEKSCLFLLCQCIPNEAYNVWQQYSRLPHQCPMFLHGS